MQTSGKTCREIAKAYLLVVTRLVRNCALGRVTQYSRDVNDRTEKPRRTGSRMRGNDNSVCVSASGKSREPAPVLAVAGPGWGEPAFMGGNGGRAPARACRFTPDGSRKWCDARQWGNGRTSRATRRTVLAGRIPEARPLNPSEEQRRQIPGMVAAEWVRRRS